MEGTVIGLALPAGHERWTDVLQASDADYYPASLVLSKRYHEASRTNDRGRNNAHARRSLDELYEHIHRGKAFPIPKNDLSYHKNAEILTCCYQRWVKVPTHHLVRQSLLDIAPNMIPSFRSKKKKARTMTPRSFAAWVYQIEALLLLLFPHNIGQNALSTGLFLIATDLTAHLPEQKPFPEPQPISIESPISTLPATRNPHRPTPSSSTDFSCSSLPSRVPSRHSPPLSSYHLIHQDPQSGSSCPTSSYAPP